MVLRKLKLAALSALALAGVSLGGCVYYPSYGYGYGYAPAYYAPAPVYVAPSFGFVFGGGYGHHWR